MLNFEIEAKFMLIGIDASRAFVKNRTGIEEYSYQVIRNLVDKLDEHEVILYVRKNQEIDFVLLKNWKVKIIKWPRFWTQIGLSLEMFFRPVDILFIPAHTVPIIHPKNSLVVIHGLEYEFCPEAYSWWERFYMRWVIKNSCRWAKTIISVSNNTKNDLMKLYGVSADKIRVIYEGVNRNFQFPISNFQSISNDKIFNEIKNNPYLLFIGRLEKRKNIAGIIKAFEILKEKYNISHKLILAGGEGYGYESIKQKVLSSKYKKDIVLTGFINEEKKWEFLKNAEAFLFPSFYEGFGLPILEAQSAGTPVVVGDNSSIPEVIKIPLNPPVTKGEVQNSALLVNSHNPQEIAEAVQRLILDKNLRNDMIKKGYRNVKRFSWKKCTDEIIESLLAN